MDYHNLVNDLRERASWINFAMVRHDGKEPPAQDVALMHNAADAIEELQKTKWISTTDRLPEKDGSYLVRFGNGLITTDTFMTFEDGHTKWYDGGDDIGGITHWMPLPEPPKEETE